MIMTKARQQPKHMQLYLSFAINSFFSIPSSIKVGGFQSQGQPPLCSINIQHYGSYTCIHTHDKGKLYDPQHDPKLGRTVQRM